MSIYVEPNIYDQDPELCCFMPRVQGKGFLWNSLSGKHVQPQHAAAPVFESRTWGFRSMLQHAAAKEIFPRDCTCLLSAALPPMPQPVGLIFVHLAQSNFWYVKDW